jgi:hypothetical protein
MDAVELGTFAAAGPALSSILELVMNKVPASIKPLVPVILGAAAGAWKASSQGLPWQQGLFNGLVMAGTAIWHHDANLTPSVPAGG